MGSCNFYANDVAGISALARSPTSILDLTPGRPKCSSLRTYINITIHHHGLLYVCKLQSLG